MMRRAKTLIFKKKIFSSGFWHGYCSINLLKMPIHGLPGRLLKKQPAGVLTDRPVFKASETPMSSVSVLKRYSAAFAKGGRCRLFVLAALLLLVAAVGDVSAAGGPLWKIGRAVVQEKRGHAGPRELRLKLSLRNTGSPGKVPVRIMGQWGEARRVSKPFGRNAGSRGRKQGLEGFVELGGFTREVAFKKTSILDIPLKPLGMAPRGARSVTVVVTTGERETDRRTVSLRPWPQGSW
ncbi:MAG: hypothetical protein ACE5GY_06490 [Thermodesulfobacteriota bacterium]